MVTIGENLRTEVLAIPEVAAITDRMGQNVVDQEDDLPYLFFRRLNEETPLCVDGGYTLTTTEFTLEAVSRDLNEAIKLVDLIRRTGTGALHGRRGDFGDQYVRGIDVTDKDEDYIYVNPSGDGIHVAGLTISIIH